MRSGCPGTHQARMRTSNHLKLKDIALTGILKNLIKKEIFMMFSSDHPDPVFAVQCALYDLCSAMQKTFYHGKISTNLCTFPIWGTISNIWSLFSCFWLTTCSVSVVIILLQWCKTESLLVIMQCKYCIWLKCVNWKVNLNQITFEKSLELYCEQT